MARNIIKIFFLLLPVLLIVSGVGWFLCTDKVVQGWALYSFRVFTLVVVCVLLYFLLSVLYGNMKRVLIISKEKEDNGNNSRHSS